MNKELVYISADHVTYSYKPLLNETNNERLWMIERQQPRSEHEFNNANTLSMYWHYSKTLNCQYNAMIQRKVDALKKLI
jgi:hypothetical protein